MRNGCWVPWSHTRNMMILEGGECFWDGAFQSRPGMAEDYFCWHASPCCLWNTHLQHRQKRNNIYQEKRILIENKSNSSLEDPVWRTVRYIWLLQILTALRVSENFWMWCQKKGWLHQSTVVSKTCKKPSKRFCEITSQTSHNSVLPKRLLSCGVRSVYHHPPPPFLQLVSSATAVSPSTAVSAGATLAFPGDVSPFRLPMEISVDTKPAAWCIWGKESEETTFVA